MLIRYLTTLRQEDVRLEALPQLMRLANTAGKKTLVFDLISTLIKQIPS